MTKNELFEYLGRDDSVVMGYVEVSEGENIILNIDKKDLRIEILTLGLHRDVDKMEIIAFWSEPTKTLFLGGKNE